LSNGNAQAVKNITCIDCHGGNQIGGIPANLKKGDPQFEHFKSMAHVEKSRPDIWIENSARNPEVLGGKSLAEDVDYIRVINPGDLRAAEASCGAQIAGIEDRKSTRLNSSHVAISYAVFCLKKKKGLRSHVHSPVDD